VGVACSTACALLRCSCGATHRQSSIGPSPGAVSGAKGDSVPRAEHHFRIRLVVALGGAMLGRGDGT
jgi:hypothetical protein